MFNSYYPFSLIQRTPKDSDYLHAEYVFQFRTEKRRYLIIAEQYEFNVYAVKFFPAERKNDKYRFNLVLNDHNFAPIITTSINVMLWLLERNPMASFAYVGANTITADFIEDKILSQRYRIYEYVMDIFLNPYKFKRYFSKKNSAVLLMNLENEDVEERASCIIDMFVELYNELDAD